MKLTHYRFHTHTYATLLTGATCRYNGALRAARHAMIEANTTTTLLLEGLRDPQNEAVWREFDSRYRPIIEAVARKMGLSEEEAADCAQDSQMQFLKAYREGKYDPHRGRLRSWLMGIVRYRVADIRESKAGRQGHRGDSALQNLPADDQLEVLWDEEQQHEILRQALDELRRVSKTHDKTIEAFELLIHKGRSAAEVAAQLSMSVQEVYVAKHRMIDRLREIVARLNAAFEEAV